VPRSPYLVVVREDEKEQLLHGYVVVEISVDFFEDLIPSSKYSGNIKFSGVRGL
jgi:hypothetical protein